MEQQKDALTRPAKKIKNFFSTKVRGILPSATRSDTKTGHTEKEKRNEIKSNEPSG